MANTSEENSGDRNDNTNYNRRSSSTKTKKIVKFGNRKVCYIISVRLFIEKFIITLH